MVTVASIAPFMPEGFAAHLAFIGHSISKWHFHYKFIRITYVMRIVVVGGWGLSTMRGYFRLFCALLAILRGKSHGFAPHKRHFRGADGLDGEKLFSRR